MDYPFANGVIKAIDERVLDKAKLIKYLKTEPPTFIKALIDYGYGDGYNGNDLENLINSELNKIKNLFKEITPNERLTNLFYLSFDGLNIKALFKKKIFNPGSVELLTNGGNIDPLLLKKAILDDDFTSLDEKTTKLLKQIQEKVARLNDARLVSTIIDNSIIDYIFKEIKRSRDETIKDYFITFVDFTNLLTLIRSKKLDFNKTQFSEMLINNGRIKLNDLLKVYDEKDELLSYLLSSYYEGRVNKILHDYEVNKSLVKLQKSLDNLLIYFMKKHFYKSFTMGPIIYYHLKKVSEAQNIRLIYNETNLDANDLLDY